MNAELADLGRINLLYGENGAGKTSFLEAINILGAGKSFRGSKFSSVISQGQDSCLVSAVIGPLSGAVEGKVLGVRRDCSGALEVRHGGETLSRVTDLLGIVPVQVINADSFRLVAGDPSFRRRYLDWGVFHVERGFLDVWRRFQRCLRQRNSLLRSGAMRLPELETWTEELAEVGEIISAYRSSYFGRLVKFFRAVLDRVAPEIMDLQIEYFSGWDENKGLRESLEASRKRDIARGFTHVGPQRADIKLLWRNSPAGDTMSRGQQKLVVCGLKLAQGRLQSDAFPGEAVCLLDDLPSGLDRRHLGLICEFLAKLNAQLFMSSISLDVIRQALPGAVTLAVFHVERGRVLNVN